MAESVLASKHLDALERLCTLLGFGIGTPIISLYALFRRKKGRPISEEDNLAELLKLFPSNIDAAVLIKIFNDPEVQAAIRASLRPLREPGVEQFQTRRRGTIIDRVSKADLLVADEAELDAESKTTEEVLNIEKVALLPHLSWHFSNKEGSFDAKIEDRTLWNEIENGEQFGYGDTMKVILATTASRTSQGKLIKNRTIPKVLFVSHVGQKSLPLPRTE